MRQAEVLDHGPLAGDDDLHLLDHFEHPEITLEKLPQQGANAERPQIHLPVLSVMAKVRGHILNLNEQLEEEKESRNADSATEDEIVHLAIAYEKARCILAEKRKQIFELRTIYNDPNTKGKSKQDLGNDIFHLASQYQEMRSLKSNELLSMIKDSAHCPSGLKESRLTRFKKACRRVIRSMGA